MIERHQVEDWFPDAEILTVPAARLPSTVTDEATRRLLTEVGIPDHLLEVVEIDPDVAEGALPTMGDVYGRDPEGAPAGSERWLCLGHAGQSLLGLDGTTGAVGQVHQDVGTRPLAGNLEAFVTTLGVVSRQVTDYQDRREFDTEAFTSRLVTEALAELRRVDPDALPAAEPAWADVLSDIAANAAWE